MVNFPVPRATLAWTDGNVEVFIDAAVNMENYFSHRRPRVGAAPSLFWR
jgi:hypothetical protein